MRCRCRGEPVFGPVALGIWNNDDNISCWWYVHYFPTLSNEIIHHDVLWGSQPFQHFPTFPSLSHITISWCFFHIPSYSIPWPIIKLVYDPESGTLSFVAIFHAICQWEFQDPKMEGLYKTIFSRDIPLHIWYMYLLFSSLPGLFAMEISYCMVFPMNNHHFPMVVHDNWINFLHDFLA